MYMGVEDVMFKWIDKENGNYIRLGEYADDMVHRAAGAWLYSYNGGLTAVNAETRTLNAYTQKVMAAEKAVATDWPNIYDILQSRVEYGSIIDGIQDEAFVNLITTTGDLQAEYEAYIERWENEGGLEYEKEATEWWAAHK